MSTPIVEGSPYPIVSVGGMDPLTLDDFAGAFVTFVAEVDGSPVTVRGAGAVLDEGPVLFYEKHPTSDESVRAWCIAWRDGGFTAKELSPAAL